MRIFKERINEIRMEHRLTMPERIEERFPTENFTRVLLTGLDVENYSPTVHVKSVSTFLDGDPTNAAQDVHALLFLDRVFRRCVQIHENRVFVDNPNTQSLDELLGKVAEFLLKECLSGTCDPRNDLQANARFTELVTRRGVERLVTGFPHSQGLPRFDF